MDVVYDEDNTIRVNNSYKVREQSIVEVSEDGRSEPSESMRKGPQIAI